MTEGKNADCKRAGMEMTGRDTELLVDFEILKKIAGVKLTSRRTRGAQPHG